MDNLAAAAQVKYRKLISERSLLFLLVSLAYIFVVIGGVFSAQSLRLQGIPLNVVIYLFPTIFLAALYKDFRAAILLCCALYAPLFCFIYFGYIYGGQSDYGFEKLDNIVFVSLAASSCLTFAMRRYGVVLVVKYFIYLMLVVLLLTILYKIKFGFLDRSVRFFLNGPIVFGWMAGLSSLVSIYVYFHERRRIFIIFALMFFMACVWSASKGPLAAFTVSFGLFLALGRKWKVFLVYVLFLAGVLLGADSLSSIPGLERLSAISRIIHTETSESDYGSVGIRLESLQDSFEMILENPYGGVGLGLWALHSSTGLEYPHNVVVELFAELGCFVGAGFYFILILFSLRSGLLGVAISSYFILCLSFSGDATYLRYLLFLLVPLFLSKNVSRG